MADTPVDGDFAIQNTDSSAVSYLGAWSRLQATENSTHILAYSGDSLASFSVAFTGQRLWYYGDVNSLYGSFSVTLDGILVQPSVPAYRPVDMANALLYNQTVEPGPHTMTVSNISPTSLTLCFTYALIRPVSIKAPGKYDVTVMAKSSSIVYTPSHAWSTDSDDNSETVEPNASLAFTFFGEYVWIQGVRDPDSGSFLVSVDDDSALRFSSWSPNATQPQVLYSRALSPGSHTIKLTNAEGGAKIGVSALVYRPSAPASQESVNLSTQIGPSTTSPTFLSTTSSDTPGSDTTLATFPPTHTGTISLVPSIAPPPTNLADNPSSVQPSQKSNTPSTAAVAAGAVSGGSVLLVVTAFCLCFYMRRSKRRGRGRLQKLEVSNDHESIQPIAVDSEASISSLTGAPDGVLGEDDMDHVHPLVFTDKGLPQPTGLLIDPLQGSAWVRKLD